MPTTPNKVTLTEVEELARKILRTYFCDSDMEFMISTFADDIIWLGGGEMQKAEGKEAVAAFFRMGKSTMIPCDMTDEVYHTLDLGNGIFLCEGVSHLQNKPQSESFLSLQQRITFVFRETETGLETIHIHNSVPYTAIRKDELFPVEAGREELDRLRDALNIKNQEYEHQTQFLERLYNTLPCGIVQFSTEHDHDILAANPMAWKYYGYNSEADYRADTVSALDRVEEKDRDRIRSIIASLKLNGNTATYRRRCLQNNGKTAWINVVMGRIVNSNGVEVIQAVFTDITEQMRLEKAQEQAHILENRSLRTAIYTVYPLIMRINLTQNTYNCFVNEQPVYRLPETGCYSDLINETIPQVYPSYQEDFAATFQPKEILRRFSEGEQEIYMELQQMGADNQYHWMSQHVIYVENPFDNNVLAIQMVKLLDAQRREQAHQEQILRDALVSANAANRAKSDFLSRMSHDIRTPMNAIIGMSAIGQLKSYDVQTVLDCFRKIDASSKYLLSLINDILDMSKIETNKMEIAHEPFEFNRFLEEVNQIIYPQTLEQGVSYEMKRTGSLEDCYIGDALRVKQVLMNLLSNALKFTPSDGRIGMDIKEASRNNGYAYVQFIVWDTGIGISKEFMKRIFQPFEQEDPGNARNNVGSGLGLSIVYNLVQLMGGTITVDSKKNEGSSFTVILPFRLSPDHCAPCRQLPKPKAYPVKEENVSDRQGIAGLHILLVEDNDLNREIAETLLAMNGAVVDTAQNGAIAVECFQNAAPDTYQVILMDIRMPVMDGLETTRQIRAMNRPDAARIPILAMSANAFEEDKKQAYAAGMNGYMVKPLDVRILIEELRKYVV